MYRERKFLKRKISMILSKKFQQMTEIFYYRTTDCIILSYTNRKPFKQFFVMKYNQKTRSKTRSSKRNDLFALKKQTYADSDLGLMFTNSTTVKAW